MLGAHVSIAGSVDLAPERGSELGCEVIQIFSKNQRKWVDKPISNEAAYRFRKNMDKYQITKSSVHASYLLNIATDNGDIFAKSAAALKDEFERAMVLGMDHLIFHPGAHMGIGYDRSCTIAGRAIAEMMSSASSGKTDLLIETTAGQGTAIGSKLEEIGSIISMAGSDRVGVCVDTCHIFAAGYDIRSEQGYSSFFEKFDSIIGLEKLRAFHINDSKNELGSRVDRHEDIGKGYMGIKPFEMLVNDPRFRDLPMYLETPGDIEDYRRNLKVVKDLRKI